MSTTYPESTRKESFDKAPIKKVELSTSTHIDAAFTDKPKQRDRIKISFEGSGKSLQAAGTIEVVAAIVNETTRVDVRRGEQWGWMVAIKMSKAPVVVAEIALMLLRGNPLGWECIRRKNSPAYKEGP